MIKNFKEYCELKQLLEDNSSAVVAFGRMNPPSVGHLEMMKDLVKLAKRKGCKAYLYLSHTTDAKKNPLSYDDKIKFVKKYAPQGLNVVKSEVRNFIDVCKEIVKLGGKNITFVCGEDRKAEYERILTKYIDEIGADNVEVYSGSRTEGISGSKLRAMAVDGDLDNFKKVSIAKDKDSETIYHLVRKGLKAE